MRTISAFSKPGMLQLTFPFDPELVASVRRILGAKFDTRVKKWSIPSAHRDKLEAFAVLIRKVDEEYETMANGWINNMKRVMPQLEVTKRFDRRTFSLRAPKVDLSNVRNTGLTRWDKVSKCFDVEPRDEAAFQRLLDAVIADAEVVKGAQDRRTAEIRAKREDDIRALEEKLLGASR